MDDPNQRLGLDQEQLLRDRCVHYRGTAKLGLQHLTHRDNTDFTLSEKNISRLVRVFETEGAQRLEPENFVPILFPQTRLQEVLRSNGVSQQDLLSDRTPPPLLRCAEDLQVVVLHGRHRLQAAEQCLSPAQGRWWTVDIYDSGECQPEPRPLLLTQSRSVRGQRGSSHRGIFERPLLLRWRHIQTFASPPASRGHGTY